MIIIWRWKRRPTLVQGMHWFQSTLATRFNRFRRESGHLFQGRYKSILIEDQAALSRVVDYIHLNPVRAKVVVPDAPPLPDRLACIKGAPSV